MSDLQKNGPTPGETENYNPPPELIEMGYPTGLKLPAPVAELVDAKLPGEWAHPAEYARTYGVEILLGERGVWGVGAGRDEHSGGPAVLFVVEPGKQHGDLPSTVKIHGKNFPVTVMEFERRFGTRASAPSPAFQTIYSGALTGSMIASLSNSEELFFANTTIDGTGTLTGTFPSLTGHGQRGVTNAHVALNLGIEDLLSKLPASFFQLFATPRGKTIVAFDDTYYVDYPGSFVPFGSQQIYLPPGDRVGNNFYELFTVDTIFPMFVWIPPFALPVLGTLGIFSGSPLSGAPLGAALSSLALPVLTSLLSFVGGFPISFLFGGSPLTFLYVDVAAGYVRPKPVPSGQALVPGPPPERRTVRGDHLSPGRPALPGENVYAIGPQLGTRWGTHIAAGMVINLSVPLPFSLPAFIPIPRPVLLFNLNLYALQIRPGDSGMCPILSASQTPNGLAGLGLFGGLPVPANTATMATPLDLVQLFGDVAM